MKTTIREFEHCFFITMIAEDMAEAAKLVRLGINHTMEFQFLASTVNIHDEFLAEVRIGKMKRDTNQVPRANGR